MSSYLADTTVIVDHLRGNKKATKFLEEYNPSISVVTVAELLQGSKDRREQATAVKICTAFQEFTIDKKISGRALELMKEFYLSHGLLFLDALIGATALENKLVLVTANVKHFRFIKGLEVIFQETLFKE